MGFRRMLPHVRPKSKSGWLRYRRRFPKDVAEILSKPAHVKDLGTRSYEEAEPLAQTENGVWLSLIQGARLNAGTSRNERLKVLKDLKSYGLVPPEAEDIDPFIITELRERVSEALDTVIKQGVMAELAAPDSLTDNNPRYVSTSIQKSLTELAKKLRMYEQMYREKGFEPSKYLQGQHGKLAIPANEQSKLANVLRLGIVQ